MFTIDQVLPTVSPGGNTNGRSAITTPTTARPIQPPDASGKDGAGPLFSLSLSRSFSLSLSLYCSAKISSIWVIL